MGAGVGGGGGSFDRAPGARSNGCIRRAHVACTHRASVRFTRGVTAANGEPTAEGAFSLCRAEWWVTKARQGH